MDQLRVVDPLGARRLMDDGAVLLDVRTFEEWAAGRASGAVHIPLFELPERLDELVGAPAVVCVCHTGVRSRRAALFLLENGVNAVNLEGGMDAWVAAGAPVEAGPGDARATT